MLQITGICISTMSLPVLQILFATSQPGNPEAKTHWQVVRVT